MIHRANSYRKGGFAFPRDNWSENQEFGHCFHRKDAKPSVNTQ